MGSWSVYCSLSKITIICGRECVLLPLQKCNGDGGSYDKYIPHTLPIFGKYDDYGNITDIQEDYSTKLIEKYYNCSIGEFCDFLTDARCGYDNKYSNWYKKEHLSALEKVKYLWVDREVWDFLSNYHPDGFGRVGDVDTGNPDFLKFLGFVYVGDNDDTRYKHNYVYTNGDIYVSLSTDNTWIHNIESSNGNKSGFCYDIDDLKQYGVDISDSMTGKEKQNLYYIFDETKRFEILYWVVGGMDRYLYDKMSSEILNKPMSVATLGTEYAELIYNGQESICETLADMITIKKNMSTFSMSWEPYVLYQTPQCGEFEKHQGILEGFVKINKSYCTDSDEND